MAPRGTRVEHYEAIAAFYGLRLLDDLHSPRVPEFVIYHAARRAAHYGLAAIRMRERPRRRAVRPTALGAFVEVGTSTSAPSPA